MIFGAGRKMSENYFMILEVGKNVENDFTKVKKCQKMDQK